MATRFCFTTLSSLGFAIACGGSQPPPAEGPPPSLEIAPPQPAEPPPNAAAPTPAAAVPVAAAPTPPPPTPAWRVTEGIATPESVLYDAALDRYLVSNINGKPVDADGNGYITEIGGDGKVTRAKFIEGAPGIGNRFGMVSGRAGDIQQSDEKVGHGFYRHSQSKSHREFCPSQKI